MTKIPPELLPTIDRFLSGKATAEEKNAVLDWYFKEFPEEISLEVPENYDFDSDHLQRKLQLLAAVEEINRAEKLHRSAGFLRHIRSSIFMKVAAALLLIVGGYFAYRLSNPTPDKEIAQHSTKASIVPGGKKADITLSNGSVISINSNSTGIIAHDGSASIEVHAGTIQYRNTDIEGKVRQTLINTISIPVGGEYTVILADGTKVWMNSGSTLSFPSLFVGKSRQVKLQGEAYFKVVGSPANPFHVLANNLEVQVLGTEFNVKAYPGAEKVQTTLLTGKIKLKSLSTKIAAQPRLLQVGEQALLEKDGSLTINKVNTQPVVAWKEGYFQFGGNEFADVMSEISRWYNVDIEYAKGQAPAIALAGRFPRTSSLEEVLIVLKSVGIKYKIEGRKLTIQD